MKKSGKRRDAHDNKTKRGDQIKVVGYHRRDTVFINHVIIMVEYVSCSIAFDHCEFGGQEKKLRSYGSAIGNRDVVV